MSVQLSNGTVRATTIEAATQSNGKLIISHTGTSDETLTQRIVKDAVVRPTTDTSAEVGKYLKKTATGTEWASGGGGGSSAWSDITGKPTTVSGYGITDAKIESGTITLGTNTITPITDISGKQNTLTPGTGIAISNDTISTDAVRSFSTVGTQTPSVSGGVADLSSLFSGANTSLVNTIRYEIAADNASVVEGETVMVDRTINKVTMAADVTLAFPTKPSGKARDFLLVLTATTASQLGLPTGVTTSGDTFSFTAGKTYLIAFTEIGVKAVSDVNKDWFYVRSIEL